MTGPEHYEEAERCHRQAEEHLVAGRVRDAEFALGLGQLHTGLANAAATALHGSTPDWTAWVRVAGASDVH
jgi:hypothetical protein